ncbi:MAG: beta-glucosidase, partial [Oscillospiraceae bacterium]
VVFHELDGEAVIPLDGIDTTRGASYVFALDVKQVGEYNVVLAAKSDMSKTAQMPVTLYTTGFPNGVFTYNGTDGAWVEIERSLKLYSRFITCRLYFGQSGLSLRDIRFEFVCASKDGAP